jgi:hypothetical protein
VVTQTKLKRFVKKSSFNRTGSVTARGGSSTARDGDGQSMKRVQTMPVNQHPHPTAFGQERR